MEVFCPADAWELAEALPEIVASRRPAYIRYNALEPAVAHASPFVMRQAEVLSKGEGVAILTYGFLLREAALARSILESRGVGVTLVNLRTLQPIDRSALRRAARCHLVVTLEDHFRTGGLFSIVAETLLAERLTAQVLPIALEDRWFAPGRLTDVLRHEGFTGARIAERILENLIEEG
jgi:transketolase